MGGRPAAALLALAFGLLGLLLGLGDFAQVARFPVERFEEFRRFPPTPLSILWIQGVKGYASAATGAERLLIGGSVVLLIGVLLLLGGTLSPRFRLLKPPGENPGEGLGSHVDLRQMRNIGVAFVLTLLLIGALRPIGQLLPGGQHSRWLSLIGGLPAWVGGEGPGNLLLLALVLVPALWWLWGPRGPVFPAEGASLKEVLVSGFLAGGAALPAFIALFAARQWIPPASYAFSLADRPGWSGLIALTLLLPVAACLYLAGVSRLYTPGPVHSSRLATLGLGALLGLGLGIGGYAQGRRAG